MDNNHKEFNFNSPIFLIAYKPDLKMKIDYAELIRFITDYQIRGFFLLSTRKRFRSSRIFNRIGQKILENIGAESSFIKYRNNLSTKEGIFYRKFLNYYSKCPICGKRNHLFNLNRIYFPVEPNQIKFKESLLNLMRQSTNYDNFILNGIKVGIPCCSCYQRIFS